MINFESFCYNVDKSCVFFVVADVEGGIFSGSGKFGSDYPMRIVWKRGFIRLVLVAGIVWMLLILVVLLFHIWSCQSSYTFFSGNVSVSYVRECARVRFSVIKIQCEWHLVGIAVKIL